MPPFQAASSRSRTRSRLTAAATLAALTLVAGGCSSSDSSSPSADTSPTTSLGGGNAGEATSTVMLGKVAGTIKKKNWKTFMKDHRKTMLKQVGEAVDTWIDGGFVGVDYPRDSFDAAFDSFTERAKKDANAQKKLMTNWDLRQTIDGVDVKKRARHRRRPGPARSPGRCHGPRPPGLPDVRRHAERVTVRGRLFLSPAHGKWQIFGYDVSKGAK